MGVIQGSKPQEPIDSKSRVLNFLNPKPAVALRKRVGFGMVAQAQGPRGSDWAEGELGLSHGFTLRGERFRVYAQTFGGRVSRLYRLQVLGFRAVSGPDSFPVNSWKQAAPRFFLLLLLTACRENPRH